MFRLPFRSARVGLVVVLLTALSTPLCAQPISAAAENQIAELLAEKYSRTPAEQKIDSTLLYASRVSTGQPMAAGFATPTSQITDFLAQAVASDRTVAVTVRGNVTAGLLAALASAGAVDVRSYPQFERVTARVPINAVVTLAQDVDVQFIAPTARAMTQKMVLDKDQVSAGADANTGTELLGKPTAKASATTSAGVTREGADLAQAAGIMGTGVKICVLSDSAYSASITKAQATKDLPATVQILENPPAGAGENEGTAILEIVYDMAPGALLAFATGTISDVDFANNIVKLRESPYNCDILADDISYPNEGAFQDGIIAQAVNSVVASGALYFSAAANSGNLLSRTSGTWEGDFSNGGASSPALVGAGNLHSFGGTNYDVLTSAGFEVTLQWSDPLGASTNDYDLFALNATGTKVIGSSTNVQNGSQDPFEYISPSPPKGSRIVVVQRPSAATRALRIDTFRGTLQVGTVGSTYGHNAAASAFTVAAVDARTHGGQFVSSDLIDFYSSDGPRKIFYQPNGSAITPGNILFGTNGGTTLSKVDITAADCVATSLSGFNPFCGTSAATPHAAAIAGLVKSAVPGISPAQIRTALTTTALDIESPGFDVDSGYGIVMAPTALLSVLTPLASSKAYVPGSVAASVNSTFTITLTNSNGVALQGIAFTDSYASGVVNASSTATLSGTGCTGTLKATAAGSTLALTNGVVPAGRTCTYATSVKSSSAASYVDGTGMATTPIALNTSLGTATLTVTGSGGPGGIAPAITSAATAKFTVKATSSFTITATGTPAPAIAITSGTLPSGLTFTNNGNGTATIAGATTAAAGTYKVQITASNATPPAAMQMLTLTVKKRVGL